VKDDVYPIDFALQEGGKGETNLPGADLNAACSGPEGARLMDEPSNKANAPAA